MTEPAPQTEQVAAATEPPVAPPAAAKPAAAGRLLPVLALLLGGGALLVAGWSLRQVGTLEAADVRQQAALEALRGQEASLAERDRLLGQQLAQLPAPAELEARRRLLGELQAGQQQLAERVERVLGASRQEWRLAEAEHLLRLASLRLAALQDVNSARFLLATADQILRDHDDPAAYAAREQLVSALESLQTLPPLDRTGLFLQLGALGERAAALNTRRPEFRDRESALPAAAQVAEGDGASRWAQWWQQVSGFVRLEFTASDEVRPLLAGQTLEQLRLALRLALEQAQWAALNAQPEVYRGALEQARALVQRYFGLDSAENQAFYDRLGELAGQPVALELPDLSPALDALQAYLGRRARSQLEGAVPQAPAAAPVQAPAPDAVEVPAAPEQEAGQ
ncbi:uroporphyrinogen-III C-methyltransferase [Pseudomonas stutzeri]|nr:uroporphyrinogen-III C-methyltransferase [Stutzerimonas stutzeri]